MAHDKDDPKDVVESLGLAVEHLDKFKQTLDDKGIKLDPDQEKAWMELRDAAQASDSILCTLYEEDQKRNQAIAVVEEHYGPLDEEPFKIVNGIPIMVDGTKVGAIQDWEPPDQYPYCSSSTIPKAVDGSCPLCGKARATPEDEQIHNTGECGCDKARNMCWREYFGCQCRSLFDLSEDYAYPVGCQPYGFICKECGRTVTQRTATHNPDGTFTCKNGCKAWKETT